MRASGPIAVLCCLFIFCSCATIPFDATTVRQHSVQMNDAEGTQYEVLSDFVIRDKAAWVIGIVPVNKPAGDNHDYLGTLIQDEIDKAGGDAAINIKMKAQNEVGDVLINIVTLGIYVPRTVTITGQVIKYK